MVQEPDEGAGGAWLHGTGVTGGRQVNYCCELTLSGERGGERDLLRVVAAPCGVEEVFHTLEQGRGEGLHVEDGVVQGDDVGVIVSDNHGQLGVEAIEVPQERIGRGAGGGRVVVDRVGMGDNQEDEGVVRKGERAAADGAVYVVGVGRARLVDGGGWSWS